MAAGNTWATMAWSGDVFFYKFLGGKPDLEFVVPEEGGMLWATPLEIPLGAQHPTDAHLFVDWFYRPEIAVQVTDWVLYMTPVEGVQDLMREKAQESKGGTARYYEALAREPAAVPADRPARGEPARVLHVRRRDVRGLGGAVRRGGQLLGARRAEARAPAPSP